MSINPDQANWFADTFARLITNVEQAVVGKRTTVELAVTCLLSGGHLLLEDVPGTGKTSLAKALANTVEGTQSRVQFTPDLLPSDITGSVIYNQRTSEFEFHKGPVFATIVLVDEVNRASPKTQSALLEVMEEGFVTVDGERHPVPSPFMVIATQNPIEQAGVYPLPEAQLDRFLMRTSLGYLDHDSTVALLETASVRDRAGTVGPLITAGAVTQMAELATHVHVDRAILAYISRLAEESRRSPHVKLGVSTRGCISLVRAVKTWALAHGRIHAIPDDVKVLVRPVLAHRMILTPDAQFAGASVDDVLNQIVSDVAPPVARGAA